MNAQVDPVNLRSIGLPQIFERMWTGGGPARLRAQWGRPIAYAELWRQLSGDIPRLTSCVPILESNRERVILFDKAETRYLLLEIETSELLDIGMTYQQMIAWLLSDLALSGLLALVREVAEEFEFRHLKELENFLAASGGADADDAQRQFIKSITD